MKTLFLALLFLTSAALAGPIEVKWEDSGLGREFVIERSEDGKSFQKVGESNESAKSFEDPNPTPFVMYTYRVRTKDGKTLSNTERGMTCVN